MVFFYILEVFLNLFTSKSTIFSILNYAYFYVLFLTTLKYHSNKFLQLKPKDEVILLSPGVLFWLLITVFSNSFLWVPIFDPNTRLRSFYFTLLTLWNCVQEANLGKVAKSCTTQIKGSIF